VGENLEYSSAVDAVVDLWGPTDLTVGCEQWKAFNKLFGGDPELAKEASPLLFVHPDAPPFLICHGTCDGAVPVNDSRRLRAALEELDVPVTYFEAPGAGHGFDHEEFYRLLTEFITTHAI
jgi:dipeptidyl aminopeptidase/acylaminoacyl peptidase